jgi:hypothetical protein
VFRESTSAGQVTSTQSVSFAEGSFSATVDLEPALLANPDLMVTVTVDGVESDGVPVGWAPRAGYAVEAGHAATATLADDATNAANAANAANLGGVPAASFYRSPTGVPWADVSGRPAAIVSEATLLSYIQSNTPDTLSELTAILSSTYFDSLSDLTTLLNPVYAAKSSAVLDGDVSVPTGTIQLGADTSDACTAPAHYGRIRWTGTAFQGCTAAGWTSFAGAPDGASAAGAARSCKQLNADYPTLPSGAYWLDIDGSTPTNAPFRAWCDMTSGNAGWTLIMKMSSSDHETLRYDSAQWSSTTDLNPDSVDPAVDANHKNAGYSSLGFTEIRMAIGAQTNTHQVTLTRASARDLFTGSTVATPYTRAQFISWSQQASSNWDNQPNCNNAGFNVNLNPGPGAQTACRYGITMNNEADCNTNDSTIGIGCHSNNFAANRYTAAGSSRWATDQRFPLRGWVWVR